MKRTIQILSVISGLVAVLAVVLNIQVLFGGNSWFFRFAMFSVVKNGGVMGYLGNLLSMIIVAAGFGGMCICGFKVAAGGGVKAMRPALLAGLLMTIMAVISLFCSIAEKMFNFGDLIIIALPAVYTFCVFAGGDKI